MQRQWSMVAPPLNISLAAWIGFKPKPKAKSTDAITEADLSREMAELEAFFAGMG